MAKKIIFAIIIGLLVIDLLVLILDALGVVIPFDVFWLHWYIIFASAILSLTGYLWPINIVNHVNTEKTQGSPSPTQDGDHSISSGNGAVSSESAENADHIDPPLDDPVVGSCE